MTFAGYLAQRFVYRIVYFLRHWYIVGGKKYANVFLDILERLDRTLAWKINILHIFTPLYKDYSFLGHVLGFFIRLLRFFVTSILYVCIFAIAFLGYILWILIPPYIIYNIIV